MDKFGLKEGVIDSIVNIIKQYKEIERASIFGSRARGDYKPTSDIDIVLYGDLLTNTINTKVFFEIEELYIPFKIDLINFNTLSEKNKLKQNIEKEGIDIYVQ